MATIQPNSYIGGFQLLAATTPAPSQGIFIPLASLPGLSAEELDAYGGDVRKFMYELNRAVFTALSNFDAASKPTKFNMTRATPIGVNATTIRQSYTTSFDLAINDVDVAAE